MLSRATAAWSAGGFELAEAAATGLAVQLATGAGAGGDEDVGAPGGFELEEAAAIPLATGADAGGDELEEAAATSLAVPLATGTGAHDALV